MTAEQLQATPQAEQRVVVRRRALDHRLELRRGLLVALGVEQRAAEGLADRGLVRGEVPRACEGDRRLVVVPFLEQLGPAAEEFVYVVHYMHFMPRTGVAHAGGCRGVERRH